MQVEVRRTGGFAGIARTWRVDTAQLAPECAEGIERLVRMLPRGRAVGADAFAYAVTVDGETFAVSDAHELIEQLTELTADS